MQRFLVHGAQEHFQADLTAECKRERERERVRLLLIQRIKCVGVPLSWHWRGHRVRHRFARMPKRNNPSSRVFFECADAHRCQDIFSVSFAESFVGGACCVAEGSLHALSASRVIMFCLIGLQAARERGFLRTGQMAARVVVWEKLSPDFCVIRCSRRTAKHLKKRWAQHVRMTVFSTEICFSKQTCRVVCQTTGPS